MKDRHRPWPAEQPMDNTGQRTYPRGEGLKARIDHVSPAEWTGRSLARAQLVARLAVLALSSATATVPLSGSGTSWSLHFFSIGATRPSWARPSRRRAMCAAVSGCRVDRHLSRAMVCSWAVMPDSVGEPLVAAGDKRLITGADSIGNRLATLNIRHV